ncbi:MAG: VWA domain-containing protein [Chitinophagales bacterium]
MNMQIKKCLITLLLPFLLGVQMQAIGQTIRDVVTVHPEVFDFGRLTNWSNPKATFTVYNGSDKTLHFLRTPSTPSINILYPTYGIQPGDSASFYIEFYTGQTGKFDEVVTLYFEESSSPFPVVIKGNILSFAPNVVSVCPAYRKGKTTSISNLSLFVRDKRTDRPLENVRIRLKSQYYPNEIIMATNDKGQLNENFPQGSFDMTLERDGYAPQTMHFDHTYRSDVIQISMDRTFDENDINYDSLLAAYSMDPINLEDPNFVDYGFQILNIVTEQPIYRADVFVRNAEGYLLESGKSNAEGIWRTGQPKENTKAEIEANGYEQKTVAIDTKITEIQEVYLTPIYEGVTLESTVTEEVEPIETPIIEESVSADLSLTETKTAEGRDTIQESMPVENQEGITQSDKAPSSSEDSASISKNDQSSTTQSREEQLQLDEMSPEERMASLINTSNTPGANNNEESEKETPLNEELPDYNQWGELNEALYKQNNLIFLIDISFSMRKHGKIAKLKKSMTTLIDVLRDFDQIGLITYNSQADTIFSSVALSDKESVKHEINSLTPSGLTYGVKGIEAAYELIQGSFLSEGNNQIILATDGLFTEDHLTLNEQELLRVVRRNNKDYGIKLSVLGFGNDANGLERMESLTIAGDGNYLEISLDHDAEHSKEILIEEIKTQSRIE